MRNTTTLLGLTLALAFPLTAQERPTDPWLTDPVDDATFTAYLEFFAYQTQVPFEPEVIAVQTEQGLHQEHLSFQSTPGVRVTGRLFRSSSVTSSDVPSVIFLHGGGPQGKDSQYIFRISEFLARAGIQVLAIDMLHFGERAAGLFETFSETEKHERLYNDEAAYLEWVQQTVKDVGRARDFLVAEHQADPDRIGVVGMSRGAVAAMIAGGADQRLAATVSLHGGHFDFYEDGHRPAACPANYIGRISPRPLLMINGEQDADFLPETAIRPLQRLVGQNAELRWTDGVHGFMSEEDLSVLASWLRDNLN